MADVLPELLGPMKTTGLPSSISTDSKRLKLRTVRWVSMEGDWIRAWQEGGL